MDTDSIIMREAQEIVRSMGRAEWDVFYLELAEKLAARSTCRRRQVGAIAIKGHVQLATGSNRAPLESMDCTRPDGYCLRQQMGVPSGERHELCRVVHAEQNLIIQAATLGFSLTNADVYCTHLPCYICAKMLVVCGIRKIIYAHHYPDPYTPFLCKDAGVELIHVQPVTDFETRENACDIDHD